MKNIRVTIPNRAERDRVYKILEALGIRNSADNSALSHQQLYPDSQTLGLFNNGKPYFDTWGASFKPYGTLVSVEEFLIAAVKASKMTALTISLNSKYTAEITKERTKVGYQVFDNAKILEVAEAIKALK